MLMSDVDDSFLSNLRVTDQSVSYYSAVNFCRNLATYKIV